MKKTKMTIKKLIYVDSNHTDYDIALAVAGAQAQNIEAEISLISTGQLDINWTENMLVSGIDQIRGVFRDCEIHVPLIDYPDDLQEFYHRSINRLPWGEIKLFEHPVWVKSLSPKGFICPSIIRGPWETTYDPPDYGMANLEDDDLLWTSDILDIKAEWRAFCIDGEVVDVRSYSSNAWQTSFDSNKINAATKQWSQIPHGCSMDWAVCNINGKEETVLLEVNDGWALGAYGLDPSLYFQLLKVRWEQIFSSSTET